MKKVRFSFIIKSFSRNTFYAAAIVFALLIGNFWAVSAANHFTDFFGATESGFFNSDKNGGVSGANPESEGNSRPNEKENLTDLLSSFSKGANLNGGINFLLPPEGETRKAIVRRGFTLNGRIEGSVQQLLGQNTIFNSGAVLTEDLLVPGTPNLIRNGPSNFGGTVSGTGSAQPSNYSVTLNSNSQLGRLINKTDPVSMPNVAAPPAPAGTRNVTINNSTQSIGDFTTLRNLTLNSNVGNKQIPPGTYGAFTANSGSGFILGVANSTQTAVYNFSSLTLNSSTQLQVVGPVVITVGTGMSLNGAMGAAANPAWLELKISSGGLTLNSGSVFYGSVTAPSTTGIVTINTARLEGNVTADRLTVNSGGVLKIIGQGDTDAPVLNIQQPNEEAVTNSSVITVSGTAFDQSQVSVSVNGISAFVNGSSFTAQVPLTEGSNNLSITATDSAGNRTEIIRSVILDTISPSVNVTQPSDFLYTTSAQASIIGNFSGAAAVTVNGENAQISGNNFSKTVNLNEGLNTVYVRAVDNAGNYSEVFQTIVRDTNAPTVSLITPTENQVVRTVKIDGTASDVSPFNITINGVAAEVVDGTFNAELNLAEGLNEVRIIATDVAGNQSEILRPVTVDLTQPIFNEVSPVGGATVGVSTTISGRITDATPATVKVNDLTVNTDVNGSFLIENVPVAEGENLFKLVAVDSAGNENDFELSLIGRDKTAPSTPVLFPVNSPTRLDTGTIEGRAEPGSKVIISGEGAPIVANAAYGTGLFAANVSLTAGINNFNIAVRDADGNASPVVSLAINYDPNLELPPSGNPAQINISTGNAQKGLINAELPRPLIAIVTDRFGEPVENAAVKFEVQAGGGRFAGNNGQIIEVTTDNLGYARANYISGENAGAQQIRADFSGNTLTPAVFLAEALVPTGGETTVSGTVLDQNMGALPNVLVRIGGQQTRTAANGRFTLKNVTSGPHQLLELIGRDQIQRPGRWTNITYDLDILPQVGNQLRRPLFLPRVNEGINLPLDGNSIVTQDTTFELPIIGGQPPIKVTAKAGTRVIFPPDVTDKRFSVTRIANNRIPMSLEDGRATNLYISVQPSGAVFETPLEISFPNLDRLPPNSEVLLMSFDHDAGRYVKVGTGHVNPDGFSVKSDPGSGIRVGAWHALPPQPPSPEVTVLGYVQIEGNPQFEGKEIISEQAWVEGERAVLLTGSGGSGSSLTGESPYANLPRLDYRATLAVPRNSPPLTSRMESIIVAEKRLKVKFDSNDGRFAPSVERCNFKYTITPGETTTAQVGKFEVFKNSDLNNPIYKDETIQLTANRLDYSQGSAVGWDGVMNQGTNSGKYIQPKDGPFTLRLTVASQSDYSDAVKAEKTLKVEISSMEITPSDDFKAFKPNTSATEIDSPVELTIKVKKKDGSGVVTAIPFKVKWSFEDPDDSAGDTTIDPNRGSGDDNAQVRQGGKRADSGGTNPAPAGTMWKTVAGFTATVSTDSQTAEAEVSTTGTTQGMSKMTFSTSVISGDNYFLIAKYQKDDGTTFQEKKSGKWSVWKRLDFQNVYKMNGGAAVDNIMTRGNINPAFNGDGYTDYDLGTVQQLTAGAQSPEYVATLINPTAAQLPAPGDTPQQIAAKAQAWFNTNRNHINTSHLNFIQTINAPAYSIIGARYYHPKYDGRTGDTNFYPPGTLIDTTGSGTPSVDPDGEWGNVQGAEIVERSFIFLNITSTIRARIVGRHEVGHASDHVEFGPGDHASSGLMHPTADQSNTNPFGVETFSADSILKLRGVRP